MGNFGPAEIAEIAEISKGTQIPQIAQKFGHHRWRVCQSRRNCRNSRNFEPSQMAGIARKCII